MSQSTKLIVGVIVVVAVVAIGYFVSKGPSEQTLTEPIKIGFIAPLTGDAANLGENSKLAVQMALEEINAQGGINGRPLEVIYEDGKCNAKDAANAGNKLINVDRVPVIIGGLCSSETLAVSPVAENSKTVMLSPCSSAPKITEAGDYIFRDYPSDNFQGKFLAEYVFNTLGLRRVATLYCLSDYCLGLNETFTKKFKELGGEVVGQEGFEQTARDLRTQLTKIKGMNPDGLYFASYTEATIPGLKQLKELGLKLKVFGADSWDDPKIWEETKEAGEGVFFTTVAPAIKEFQEKFASKTGKTETICAAQSYDAVYLIADIMKRGGLKSEDIKNALYQVKNYPGVSGTIGFDEKGNLLEVNYIIKVVKEGKAVEMK